MLRETIKLDMNEMPYLPPQEIIDAAQKGLSRLNRYSDPQDLNRLRELLADYSGVAQENIILSPGSDFLLREVIHTVAKGRKVVMVSPSFFPTVQAAKDFATEHSAQPPNVRCELGPTTECVGRAQPGDHRQS